MKYICSCAEFPRDRVLLSQVNVAASRLHPKIAALDVSSVGISEYNQRYFKDHQSHLLGDLQRMAFILSWAISTSKKPLSDLVFVDYGGGAGFLALLAKELGIGTVIYNDIYDVSCRDAEVIGNSLGVPADQFVQGDVDELLGFLKFHDIYCDALASYDVLEHIYDVDSFLTKLCTSPHGPTTFIMASGANPRNLITRKRLMKRHLEYEYRDREKIFGHKERDTLRAFYSVREEAIRNSAPELTPGEIQSLAERTRGKMIEEVLDCVANYKKTKILPPMPSHPTNTCDPFTGSWEEQLLDLDHMKRVLLRHGASGKILSGYWMTGHTLKGVIALALNLLISNLGQLGIRVAPFYALSGIRDTDNCRCGH